MATWSQLSGVCLIADFLNGPYTSVSIILRHSQTCEKTAFPALFDAYDSKVYKQITYQNNTLLSNLAFRFEAQIILKAYVYR